MAKKADRIVITLGCSECHERDYTTQKNRKNDSGRMTLRKFCRRCGKHTEHREQR